MPIARRNSRIAHTVPPRYHVSMSRAFAIILIALFGPISGIPEQANAQSPVVTPANPTNFKKREISGGSSTGVGIVSQKAQTKKVITINFTSVTPLRVWTNLEGKGMQARLLAFSAPEEGTKGPVEVIRDGKVRFLLEKATKPSDYVLNQLSETDQTYIKNLAEAAAKVEPAKVSTTAEPVNE